MNAINDITLSASRGSQNQVNSRLQTVRRNEMLLQKKSERLQTRFQEVSTKLIHARSLLSKAMKNAFISSAELKYVAGNINKFALENVSTARTKIRTKKETISGIELYTFESYENGPDCYEYLCLARGGQQVKFLFLNSFSFRL